MDQRAIIRHLVLVLVSGLCGAGVMRFFLAPKVVPVGESAAADGQLRGSTSTGEVGSEQGTVALEVARWEAAGLQLESVTKSDFPRLVSLTGKVSLNEDRIAHIYPMVAGAVDEVHVGLGQVVKKDDLMVIIHSREIGQAKLQLYQARLQREMALVRQRLQTEVTANAHEMIELLRRQQPIAELEPVFRNRPMGDFRERLMASYSSYLKSKADVARLENVSGAGAVSGSQFLAAKANLEADLATFQSRIEQIEYEMTTSELLASQNLREAETQVAVAATSLRILGVDERDIQEIDPVEQGESISHYPIRAPFDGTVISKDVVLREQVRTESPILNIADLSTVWITADIYQENIPLLAYLENQEVKITNEAWPSEQFTGTVFYAGEIMDEATRTISMRAIANNDRRMLKPGMFVSVSLSVPGDEGVFRVPTTAIQEHDGKKFVFVHLAEEKFAQRFVTLGGTDAESTAILAGLEEGEQVVVRGGFILKSQMLGELMGEE